MERYLKEIPLVIRNSIKALCDENRQVILIYLLRAGSKSFTEISKELKISKNNLSHHIKTLMRYGLIYNFYNRNKFADKYSFYEISKLGKGMINPLINFITPITSKKEGIDYIATSDANLPEEWGLKREEPINASTGLQSPPFFDRNFEIIAKDKYIDELLEKINDQEGYIDELRSDLASNSSLL